MLIHSTDPPEFICSVCFIHAEERMLWKLPKKVTVLITDKNQWVAVESSDAFLFSVMRKYWIRTAELSVLNSYTDMTVLLYADQLHMLFQERADSSPQALRPRCFWFAEVCCAAAVCSAVDSHCSDLSYQWSAHSSHSIVRQHWACTLAAFPGGGWS